MSPVQANVCELAPPPFAHRLGQGRVAVAHEVEERVGLAMLFTHEEKRHVR